MSKNVEVKVLYEAPTGNVISDESNSFMVGTVTAQPHETTDDLNTSLNCNSDGGTNNYTATVIVQQ